jgi:type IV secretory pathway VirB3-like protein
MNSRPLIIKTACKSVVVGLVVCLATSLLSLKFAEQGVRAQGGETPVALSQSKLIAGVHWYNGEFGGDTKLVNTSFPVGERGWNIEYNPSASGLRGDYLERAKKAQRDGLVNIIRLDFKEESVCVKDKEGKETCKNEGWAVPKFTEPFTIANPPKKDDELKGLYEAWKNDIIKRIEDYSGVATVFIVGNEPTIEPASHGGTMAVEYSTAFNYLYKHKSSMPSGTILLAAGPAHNNNNPGRECQTGYDWLQEMSGGLVEVDGFAIHAYGNPEHVCPADRPQCSCSQGSCDATCDDPRATCNNLELMTCGGAPAKDKGDNGFQGFREQIERIGKTWSPAGGKSPKPIYITEFNTAVGENADHSRRLPSQNYKKDWIKKAFEAVRDYNKTRNQTTQPPVLALCWFVDRADHPWEGYALSNTDEATMREARADMKSEFSNPENMLDRLIADSPFVFSEGAFEKRWEATDGAMPDDRSWTWGPGSLSPGIIEEYAHKNLTTNKRLVQYFDKARMEINNPAEIRDRVWFVHTGLLVKEMIEGKIQVSDSDTVDRASPETPIAGDPPPTNNSPAYSKLKPHLAGVERDDGKLRQVVKQQMSKEGKVSTLDTAPVNVTYAAYIGETRHYVPDIFNNYLNGPIHAMLQSLRPGHCGRSNTGEGCDINWVYLVGLPVTEPYWVRATVGGTEKDVLFQAFERRVLTYTPTNTAKYKIEMGNVGLHYYRWRYPNGPYTPLKTANLQATTLPTSTEANRQQNVSVTMRNDGTGEWTSAGGTRSLSRAPSAPIRLEAADAATRETWGVTSVSLPRSVPQGETVTFDFPISTPSRPGLYKFKMNMAQDGVAWTGNSAVDVLIRVGEPAADSSNPVNGFSSASNPSGAWSYGHANSDLSGFTKYTSNGPIDDYGNANLDAWFTTGRDFPNVTHNHTGTTQEYGGAIQPSDMLMLHPGADGKKSVLRWAAPSSGTFTIRGRFEGIEQRNRGTTSDVTVLHNTTPLFSSQINGFGERADFAFVRAVAAGDTIDFAVGYGSNREYRNDSTGLVVDIVPGGNSGVVETQWVEDAVPGGAAIVENGDSWQWISAPTHYSGSLAHASSSQPDFHQHYFHNATETLSLAAGDVLTQYVYLDPANMPGQIMLQWQDQHGSFEHRAYWGGNLINVGTDGTTSRRYMGELPAAGRWVRLEVPASVVGLAGGTAKGMAYTLHGGTAFWDLSGKASALTVLPPPRPVGTEGDTVWVGDLLPSASIPVADDEVWQWVSANTPAGPFSGTIAHRSAVRPGFHQHYFHGASEMLTVNTGDVFVQYVYLDPANMPEQIMLQWRDQQGSFEHRAYWGANLINVGTDGTPSRRYMGELPAAGQWARLEIPAKMVGLDASTVNGMAYTLHGGTAFWDHSGKATALKVPPPPPPPGTGSDTVWVGDVLPIASIPVADGEVWQWVSTNTPAGPFSGTIAHRSAINSGFHQHYFHGTSEPLTVNTGDVLVQYVYLDPANMPAQLMLQWKDQQGSFEHRAYWGASLINAGTEGTQSRRYMGALPAAGRWVRLEVPARLVGLENNVLQGMAYTLHGGTAFWDHSGKATALSAQPPPRPIGTESDTVWVGDLLPTGAVPVADGEVWHWTGTDSTPAPFSGVIAHRSATGPNQHQHYFRSASEGLTLNTGDKLVQYVYLIPGSMPEQIMLQWEDPEGSFEHRAYWGASLINAGTEGTQSRHHMGALPAAGGWVRLEVPASLVGLEGKTVKGMAYTLHGGTAFWDHSGKVNH